MNALQVSLWQRLRGNFAFLPAAALAAGVLAGVGMLYLDHVLVETIELPPALLASPQIARSALTAIATSSLTIAALAVSLTLAVLTHAGAQFSPRVLKTFLADGISQTSIGLLLAVHAYCLVVMRGIGGDAGVPHLSVGLGVLSGFVSVALLVYYLHHLASSLRASRVVAAIAAETAALLESMQQELAEQPACSEWPPMHGPSPRTVEAPDSGYLQSVDAGRLDALAKSANAFISIEVRLGEFVCAGEPLACIWPPDHAERLQPAVLAAARIGEHPECEQDPYCGMSQLVDLALRALSPGLNDPHSAGLAVDRLGALLGRALDLQQSREGRGRLGGEQGRVRMLQRSGAQLIADCFDPIRQNAAGQCLLLHRVLLALQRIAVHTRRDSELDEALRRQLQALSRAIDEQVSDPDDARALLERVDALRARLQQPAAARPCERQAEAAAGTGG